jgi:hypothetical protein
VLTCAHNFYHYRENLNDKFILKKKWEKSICILNCKGGDRTQQFEVIDVIYDKNYIGEYTKLTKGYDLAIAIIKPLGNNCIPPTLCNDFFGHLNDLGYIEDLKLIITGYPSHLHLNPGSAKCTMVNSL